MGGQLTQDLSLRGGQGFSAGPFRFDPCPFKDHIDEVLVPAEPATVRCQQRGGPRACGHHKTDQSVRRREAHRMCQGLERRLLGAGLGSQLCVHQPQPGPHGGEPSRPVPITCRGQPPTCFARGHTRRTGQHGLDEHLLRAALEVALPTLRSLARSNQVIRSQPQLDLPRDQHAGKCRARLGIGKLLPRHPETHSDVPRGITVKTVRQRPQGGRTYAHIRVTDRRRRFGQGLDLTADGVAIVTQERPPRAEHVKLRSQLTAVPPAQASDALGLLTEAVELRQPAVDSGECGEIAQAHHCREVPSGGDGQAQRVLKVALGPPERTDPDPCHPRLNQTEQVEVDISGVADTDGFGKVHCLGDLGTEPRPVQVDRGTQGVDPRIRRAIPVGHRRSVPRREVPIRGNGVVPGQRRRGQR